jgi:replicative DNA helicase
MSLARCFLFSLVSETENRQESERRIQKALQAGIDEGSFEEQEDREVWKFIEGYYRRYREMPGLSVVEVECDVRFPNYLPEEPFDYWLEQLRLFNQHVFLTDGAERLIKYLNASQTRKAAELISDIETGLLKFEALSNAHTLLDLAEEAIKLHKQIQHGEIESGIPTGIEYIDQVTGGAQAGDEWVIAGRPGSGKTFIACRIGMGARAYGKRVLFISMEMAGIQIARRNVSMEAHVTAKYLRLGRLSHFAMRHLEDHVQRMRETEEDPTSFMVVDGGLNLSVKDVLNYIRRYKPELVIVDGAYMLKAASTNARTQWENVLMVTSELKQIAQNENIPVITTHQFNRKGESDKSLANIAYTDAIPQIASVVVSLASGSSGDAGWRNITYKILELIKGREGERGKIRVRCDMMLTQIEQDSVLVGDPALMDDGFSRGEGGEDPEDQNACVLH